MVSDDGGGGDTTTLHTRAWLTFEENIKRLIYVVGLQNREAVAMRAAAARMRTHVKTKAPSIMTKAGAAQLMRSLEHYCQTLDDSVGRLDMSNLWLVVLSVTCVEAYLHDLLSIAASVDPELMRRSKQRARYADIIVAASLDELTADLRARWARRWLDRGGPTRWLSRLGRMGAKDYPDGLAPRMERIWGIRHVVVHAAGVATADFVKRHPGVVAARGDRLRVTSRDVSAFLQTLKDFVEPTEVFFLARYPEIPRMKLL